MIRLTNVCKAFGENKVITDLCCEFEHYGVYAIMGKSGCGKTTLLSMIMGTLSPDSGKIEGVCKPRAVFQEDRLLENRSALENLLFVGEGKERALALLSELGLGGFENTRAKELSGGMKRRVALARALFASPELLLLDEAFNAVDEVTKRIMLEKVKEFGKEHTVILVTHDQSEAEFLGSKIIRL